MKRFFKFLKENYKNIFRAFLFLLTIAIIVYIFPREGKFRYEFQKGRPWMHENLIAPFDFSIYKSDKQLQDEQDSILQSFYPYFKYDSAIFIIQERKFLNYYASKEQDFINKKEAENAALSQYRKQNFIKKMYSLTLVV